MAEKSLSDRRKLLSRLISLYESLLELEHASKDAYGEFYAITYNSSAPTKVVIKSKLSRLSHAYKGYLCSLADAQTLISIYDHPLELRLIGARRGKSTLLQSLSLALFAIPSQKSIDEKITFEILYPTSLPDFSKIKTDTGIASKQDLAEHAKSIQKILEKGFELKAIDSRNIVGGAGSV